MAAGAHTNGQDEQTFGRFFSSLRTQKGIDLKTISDETRIAPGTLRLLEEEAYDRLPDTVFVKGFLKSCAKVMDTPAEPLIQSFLAGRGQYNERLRREACGGRCRAAFWRNIGITGAIVAVLLYVAFSALSPSNGDTPVTPNTQPAETASDGDAPFLSDATQAESATQSTYLLQVTAVEETWLKIHVDRQDSKEYLLNPGDRLELKASRSFNLLIGNAAGIQLKFNHQPVAIEGRHGDVVTLKLPR